MNLLVYMFGWQVGLPRGLVFLALAKVGRAGSEERA